MGREAVFTFLFTDIEGSTALWESDAEAGRARIAQHDAVMRAAIEGHGGCVFKTVGDAFCVVFGRATDAVAAALMAQTALADTDSELVLPSDGNERVPLSESES
jgi:class 3 adenylate cyclase